MKVKTVKQIYNTMPKHYIACGNRVTEVPMTAIVVVKHEGCDKLFHFQYYRRIQAGTEVLVETKKGQQPGVVQGSYLIPTKHLEYFFKAYGIRELKQVVGTIETVTTKRLLVETDDAAHKEV